MEFIRLDPGCARGARKEAFHVRETRGVFSRCVASGSKRVPYSCIGDRSGDEGGSASALMFSFPPAFTAKQGALKFEAGQPAPRYGGDD